MSFVKAESNLNKIQDAVFRIVALAKQAKATYGEDAVVDATIGSLYTEDGNLVAYHTVFDTFDAIDSKTKAGYASSFTGNPNFREQVKHWLFHDINLNLPSSVIATPGGSGAVSMALLSCISRGQCALLPEIAWGSYKLMCQENGLNTMTYSLFDENDHFNLKDFKEKMETIMAEQQRVIVVLNDPCHNPTGYTLTDEEWSEVIAILNSCSQQGPVVLLNDIAYLDYSYDLTNVHKYMEHFNDISDNVAVIIAFSCSKSLTSYGMRIGAAIALAKQQNDVDQMETVFEKHARAMWSNINNAGMENFVRVTTDHLSEFEAEKQQYVDLLKARSDIFVSEAKACQLPCYPYKEGFFVTVRVDDNDRCTRYHQALLDNNIFTVKVNKGIRVAVCSVSQQKCRGLAQRMKEILDTIK